MNNKSVKKYTHQSKKLPFLQMVTRSQINKPPLEPRHPPNLMRLHAFGKLFCFCSRIALFNKAQQDSFGRNQITFEAKFHPSPSGVSYSENPTVFGRILEGSIPSYTYLESDDLIAIRDRTMKAKFHALVIPKQFIESIKTLEPKDSDLLNEMKSAALCILEENCPEAYRKNDYILCFHVPPFISVGHLHLHVLAPASEMKSLYKLGKYLVGTPWCTGVDNVIDSLAKGKKA